MCQQISFFLTNLFLGIGLSMDAFSVSLANGLSNPCISKGKMCFIAAIYGFLQGAMPVIGWIIVHTIIQYFRFLDQIIPWIALGLLTWIGIKMIQDSRHASKHYPPKNTLSFSVVLLQGIATSIDALSVGFTTAHYNLIAALAAASIIAAVTFVICFFGLMLGKTMGTKLAEKAGLFGGCILLFIGLEIFLTSLF